MFRLTCILIMSLVTEESVPARFQVTSQKSPHREYPMLFPHLLSNGVSQAAQHSTLWAYINTFIYSSAHSVVHTLCDAYGLPICTFFFFTFLICSCCFDCIFNRLYLCLVYLTREVIKMDYTGQGSSISVWAVFLQYIYVGMNNGIQRLPGCKAGCNSARFRLFIYNVCNKRTF